MIVFEALLISFTLVNSLSNTDALYLRLCEWIDNGHISREAYTTLQLILCEERALELPLLDRKDERLIQITGLQPQHIDCCINSCIAYTGQYLSLNTCPKCRHPRWRHGEAKPFRTFMYIPLAERLQLQYKARLRTRVMQTYCAEFFNKPKEYIYQTIKDWWCGS